MSKLFKLSIIGFIFVSIAGTLCHFIYEWSGYNIIAGILFPVNESVWEHLKLLFITYLIWAVIEYLMNKEKIFFSKSMGVIAGELSIAAFYYGYTLVLGKNIEFLNILSFFIGVLLAFIVDRIMIKSHKFNTKFYNTIGIFILAVHFGIFILFTFIPPLVPLFKDPINSTYGI